MLGKIDNSLFLRLMVNPDYYHRLVRHTLLWSTALFLIYRGFRFLATSIPSSSPDDIRLYTVLSSLFFGGLTIGAYWVITTLTYRFILTQFQPGRFALGILSVHIITATLVFGHFIVFTRSIGLNHLPRFYTLYSDHITQLRVWQAPFDSVIVWFFSFSLFYNYLIYAVGLKVFKDLFTLQLRQNELEKENLRLEFDFLKAQINPHFLLNTLNNIYSFSIQSPHRVADTILKLADLMRYALYETNDDFVPLQKELTFLTSYVDLQRIRHNEDVRIQFDVNGHPGTKVIPPLLLIVFVENAFKHGIQSSAQASWIQIQLNILSDTLFMQIDNSLPPKNAHTSGGIGLRNVRKRLDFFYADRYQLVIHEHSSHFQVTLTVEFDESIVPRYRR